MGGFILNTAIAEWVILKKDEAFLKVKNDLSCSFSG